MTATADQAIEDLGPIIRLQSSFDEQFAKAILASPVASRGSHVSFCPVEVSGRYPAAVSGLLIAPRFLDAAVEAAFVV